MNPDELDKVLDDVARRFLVLNHKLVTWYSLACIDPNSDSAINAGGQLEAQVRDLLQTILDAIASSR